jgi:hypothetical protein
LLVSTGMKTTFEFWLRAISRSDSMYFIDQNLRGIPLIGSS